jgi:hypothetical protein
MSTLTRGLAMMLLIAATACGSDKPLKVTNIQLGRSLNADTSVGNFTTTFAPSDTVHVAVLTEGSGDATISVRWTFAGQVLGEPKKQVSFKDVAVTEFHLENATGFPPGDYNVEVFLNGQSVGVRPFKVGKR